MYVCVAAQAHSTAGISGLDQSQLAYLQDALNPASMSPPPMCQLYRNVRQCVTRTLEYYGYVLAHCANRSHANTFETNLMLLVSVLYNFV